MNNENKEKKDISKETTTSGGSYIITGGILGLIFAVIIGFIMASGGNSFLGGMLVAGIFSVPIGLAIGSRIDYTNKVNNQVPAFLEQLENQGIDTSEDYISSIGSGIVIDRKSRKLGLFKLDIEKPAILNFENIKECKIYEKISSEISPSNAGENGLLVNDQYLKESGHYDSRRIVEYYDALGVNLKVSDGTSRIYDFFIPYIIRKTNKDLATETRIMVESAVDNINSAINSKSNIKDPLSKFEKIMKKVGDNKDLTKSEYEFICESMNMDEVIELTPEEKESKINFYNTYLSLFEAMPDEIDSNKSKDLEYLKKNANKAIKALNKEKYTFGDEMADYMTKHEMVKIIKPYQKKIDNIVKKHEKSSNAKN